MSTKISNIYNIPIYYAVNDWWTQNATTIGMALIESTTFLKIVLGGLEVLKKAERNSASIKSTAEELPMILFREFANKIKKNKTSEDCYRCTILANCIIITCLNHSDSIILKEGIKLLAYWNLSNQAILPLDANLYIIKFQKDLREIDRVWMRDYWNQNADNSNSDKNHTKLKNDWTNEELLFANSFLNKMMEEDQCDFFHDISLCNNMKDFVNLILKNWKYLDDSKVKEKDFCSKAITIIKFTNSKGGEWTLDAFRKNMQRHF